ncbi:peptide chain release factor N(5)-glutamine methyltransferase [Microbulbifer hydrolyticus]|uniref:Release factor glutamine methyltransferase n=1 Tax=Microbulbifer hydrolyticus TaxID=48074 RepID=A0A6P1T9I7_9GAMM|nr:peptide chain release factor N(5)-glutamine methyltransferase [Microbulbifer hydrolyticus]MBB5212787.1 release factor glutamine methyltransferase [Microbulbifer hydrolyticus]QHQ38415.1 peptide chain release factor N(5)-glutamine methyltransferase [Microbulbifer hydrolyticus]
MATVKENLQRATELQHSDSPRLDLEVLLCHLLGKSRAWLYTWPEHQLDAGLQAQFEQLLERRIAGEPVAHLTGSREFWSLPLKVNRSTLIPRPDTEVLVEVVLALCPQEKLALLDLGTGTGAIALALASEKPGWSITAVDKMPAAVALAQENRDRLGFDHVSVLQSDWFSALDTQRFDVIVSNPPYIDTQDPHLREGDVRFEPRSALVAEEQGLADIRRIAADARTFLAANGLLLVEHGWEQGKAVRGIFTEAGYDEVETRLDYAGRERVTLGRYRRP